jgi:hypothetical protein
MLIKVAVAVALISVASYVVYGPLLRPSFVVHTHGTFILKKFVRLNYFFFNSKETKKMRTKKEKGKGKRKKIVDKN